MGTRFIPRPRPKSALNLAGQGIWPRSTSSTSITTLRIRKDDAFQPDKPWILDGYSELTNELTEERSLHATHAEAVAHMPAYLHENGITFVDVHEPKHFSPTLTLQHPLPGWDGTHGAMFHELADVLHDGPVDAQVVYLSDAGLRTVTGSWTSYAHWEHITIDVPGGTLAIDIDDIQSISI